MPETRRTFVFHDPTGKRWQRFRRTAQILLLIAMALATLVIVVGLTGPQLPALGLPSVAQIVEFNEVPSIIRNQKVAKNIPYRIAKPQKPIRYVRSASPVIKPRPAAPAQDGAPLVWGYYVNWDRASQVSLRLHLNHLTHLVPEWFVLQNDQGGAPCVSACAASKERIAEKLGDYDILLSYPGGAFDASLVEDVRHCGFRGAVTSTPIPNMPPLNGADADLFRILRIPVEPAIDLAQFAQICAVTRR